MNQKCTFSALPNEQGRLDILKIHSRPIATHGEIDFESVVKLSDGFNGADLRNVCTEAGLFAIRAERDFVNQEDMMKGTVENSWIKFLKKFENFSYKKQGI